MCCLAVHTWRRLTPIGMLPGRQMRSVTVHEPLTARLLMITSMSETPTIAQRRGIAAHCTRCLATVR